MKRRKLEKSRKVREFASKKFRDALSCLLKSEKILGFLETKQNSHLDSEGIDWLVYLRGGLVAVIQTKQKTSGKSFRGKLKRHLELHPHVVIVFGIEQRHKTSALAKRIVKKINKLIRETKAIDLSDRTASPELVSAPQI